METEKSCVHLYCGNGKGKTTAGMGLCVRAAGSGKRVLIYQFMKDNSSSELKALDKLSNITRIEGPEMAKFTFQMTPQEMRKEYERNNCRFHEVTEKAGLYDLLFLDEAIYAIKLGLLDEQLVLDFLKNRPGWLEVVLTGRNPSPALMEAADYITEMKKIKHPFDQGCRSRKGIEF